MTDDSSPVSFLFFKLTWISKTNESLQSDHYAHTAPYNSSLLQSLPLLNFLP